MEEAAMETEVKRNERPKDWPVLLGVLSVVLAVAGFFLWRTRAPAAVPTIEGIPVADYTVRLEHAHLDSTLLEFLARDRKTALPVLIEQMDVDETRLQRFMTRMWKSVPERIRERFKDRRTAEQLRAGASWGLLMLLANDEHYLAGRFVPVSREEAELLLPALRGGLSDTNHFVRLNTAAMLGSLQVMPSEALELCRIGKMDPHYGVRFNTAHSLAKLMTNAPQARVELESMRGDKHPEVRDKVSESLGEKTTPTRKEAPGGFE